MMSIRYSDEVLEVPHIHQKPDIQRFDLLDFRPNIKGFFELFLAVQKQICYYFCILVDNKRGKIKID
jgi:hypothetical protein